MYGLAWKLSEEEKLLLATPEQVEDNLLFSSAIAVKYVESPLMQKYGYVLFTFFSCLLKIDPPSSIIPIRRKMQPDYTYMGSLHWHALVLKTNETPPYSMMEEFIQEVMDLYNIKTRPIWYMYASILT
jgi:hypothetical protein